MGERKYNFEDDQSVADLLGSLPRVAAPTNFDARVHSRIAQGRPSSGRAWLIPSAAVSLCVVVLAAAAFVYLRGTDEQMALSQPENVPVTVAESPNPQFTATGDPEPTNVISQPSVENKNIPAPAVVAEKRDAPATPRRQASPERGGGSYRIGVGESKDPIVPFGMPTPGATPEIISRQTGPVVRVSAREVLQLIGLDAEFETNGWHVGKVAENSLAGRSGVRDGDVVEAIDDVKVIGNTTFESGFNGKNLTILRNGNRQTISIQNR